MDRISLRSELVRQRQRLDEGEVAELSARIAARVWKLPAMSRCRRIACYFAVRGEVDCGDVIEEAWRRNREVYLPVLAGQQLVFAPYQPATELELNRFGIPEPRCPRGKMLRARQLDVALCPLVAFDAAGNRLGMGGGYYDRTFRSLTVRAAWLRPHMIGLGYEFQKTARIEAYAWDVPLHAVITEARCHQFRRAGRETA